MANEKRLIDANAFGLFLLGKMGFNPASAEMVLQWMDEYTKKNTVDAVEVVHASWIEDGYDDIPCVCSHCGNEAHYVSTFQEQFDYDWEENLVSTGYEEIKEYIRSDYCPNCGAIMDGGNEDGT